MCLPRGERFARTIEPRWDPYTTDPPLETDDKKVAWLDRYIDADCVLAPIETEN